MQVIQSLSDHLLVHPGLILRVVVEKYNEEDRRQKMHL